MFVRNLNRIKPAGVPPGPLNILYCKCIAHTGAAGRAAR